MTDTIRAVGGGRQTSARSGQVLARPTRLCRSPQGEKWKKGRFDAERQIFDTRPSDWRELQSLVRQAFVEMGCPANCDCDIPVSTVRGTVDVDVLVVDRARPPFATYIVECKMWKRRVPQTVIHAFRTVVADSGAQTGFIVSGGGFQKVRVTLCTNRMWRY